MKYNITLTCDNPKREKRFQSSDIDDLLRQLIRQRSIWSRISWDRNTAEQELELSQELPTTFKLEKECVKQIVKQINEERAVAKAAKDNILINGLKSGPTIDWNKLIDHSVVEEPMPAALELIELPAEPRKPDFTLTIPSGEKSSASQKILSREPLKTDLKYVRQPSIFQRLYGQKQNPDQELQLLFEKEHQEWEQKCKSVYADWENECKSIREANDKLVKEHESKVEAWKQKKRLFLKQQEEHNSNIKGIKEKYSKKENESIVRYFDTVLSQSEYPITFNRQVQLEYNDKSCLLVVEYLLPSLGDFDWVKAVKFNQAQDRIEEVQFSASEINASYDNALYSITLRTLHELFFSDSANVLQGIVFNGYVESIDKGTGKTVRACVLSIQASRQEFSEINLEKVEPKTCFKTLKGIGSSKLHSLTPIAPILKMEKADKRFVQSYEVVDGMQESDNLAAMDWEDFEHLIREVFEKEFAKDGGEVRVTQASRDGGVDAIAFDPDPIRGGKLVIQAKRYTNTVGVSAVRDLYGTLMNEGATKGILVTTSDYGPDAYEFAKGKPITLLNGSNLLHLLEKHGHRAIIDLRAAKTLLAEKEKDALG